MNHYTYLPALRDKRITVMGLGLHGGGTAAARFCVLHGARVTVTDLRSAEVLAPSVADLQGLDIRFVLGEHREEDFTAADLIVKNPAVPRNARWLQLALDSGAALESDISLFLRSLDAMETAGGNYCVIAVTGSKGKSSTSSAIDHCIRESGRFSRLGGNITVSPLNFLSDLESAGAGGTSRTDGSSGPGRTAGDIRHIVLELSSFQIGDLEHVTNLNAARAGKPGLQLPPLRFPDISVLTNIFRDHQDYYGSMDAYVQDKIALFRLSRRGGAAVIMDAGDWENGFAAAADDAELKLQLAGNIDEGDPVFARLLPENPLIPGRHQRRNFIAAALVLRELSLEDDEIRSGLGSFPGVEHRLQFIGHLGKLKVYNDSAATIPEAALAAVEAFGEDVYLIAGGSDKKLDLSPMLRAMSGARCSYLLKGSASDRVVSEFSPPEGLMGIYDDLGAAIDQAVKDAAAEGKPAVLLLSPGCASFGLFLNEFDRGRKFIDAVKTRQDYAL